MELRTYGESGASVIVLHGGPAAAGEAAPIARGLAGSFRVLEPWQRGSGDRPLTVARHVADLQELIETRVAQGRPALVGESWGAMLALAYAAAHPDRAAAIVLIGCGTFDAASRGRMKAILDERTDDGLRARLGRLPVDFPDPGERLLKRFDLTRSLYEFDPVEDDPPDDPIDGGLRDDRTFHAGGGAPPPFDLRAHTETWQDMLRLQERGIYPAAFSAIRSPVLMIHGAYDPHPGRMIRASLLPHLPQLEYREMEDCGHSPWSEKAARVEFFRILREWLLARCEMDGGRSRA